MVKKEIARDSIPLLVESGYELYLDGQEIEREKIRIENSHKG